MFTTEGKTFLTTWATEEWATIELACFRETDDVGPGGE